MVAWFSLQEWLSVIRNETVRWPHKTRSIHVSCTIVGQTTDDKLPFSSSALIVFNPEVTSRPEFCNEQSAWKSSLHDIPITFEVKTTSLITPLIPSYISAVNAKDDVSDLIAVVTNTVPRVESLVKNGTQKLPCDRQYDNKIRSVSQWR
jgi:hypothetical protein